MAQGAVAAHRDQLTLSQETTYWNTTFRMRPSPAGGPRGQAPDQQEHGGPQGGRVGDDGPHDAVLTGDGGARQAEQDGPGGTGRRLLLGSDHSELTITAPSRPPQCSTGILDNPRTKTVRGLRIEPLFVKEFCPPSWN